MIKTSSLTKTLFNHQNHSQSINLYTPSTTPSSGSVSEIDPSSLSSSYKSNIDTQINDEINSLPSAESTVVIINLIDKLKRELATVKQAKCQLASLYKVKCKSDLDKSAKITKLRLQYEYELNAFCKQDQRDLVCYLQRQLLARDQRIAEQSYDLEQLRNLSIPNSIGDDNPTINKKTAPIQVLRTSNADHVNSTNPHISDEQKHNLELQDRVKRFERQFEVLRQDRPKDHDRELIKRALAQQANKDAIEYQKLLTKKNEEIEQLNIRLQQASRSTLLESALRQANIEKLHLERRLLTSTATSSSLNFITNVRSSNTNPSTSTNEQQPYTTTSVRSRADSSTTSSIDPFHYQALQDTNEALKSEVYRLSRADDENNAKLKLQLEQYSELQEAYRLLQNEYTDLSDVAERFNDLQTKYQKEKSSMEYSLRENDQLKSQNEHLLNELTRLTQIETRDRSRTIEQADLRRQYDELFNQYNELNQHFNELKVNYQENQLGYENDIKHFNDEIIRYRLENEQLQSANDLLRDERNQMKESHETILKKRLDEIKYLQIENRDLQVIRQKYNEERETFQAIDLRKTQLENDLLTMQAVEDRCQDLQTTVERLQTEVQLSQKKSDDHTMALTNLNKENARLIKELESASMLNTQMRTEISNATNTNERLIEEIERHRTNILTKSDECDAKRREIEQLISQIRQLESTIKSLRDTSDFQKQLNVENEVNKLELKRKQDDFEQFQLMHDVTKRENQDTIHLLEEKIHDLERKTELQSLKHEEILLEFESLKTRRDRILPSSTGSMLSNNQLSPLPSPHHWPLPTMVDSQTSPTDDDNSSFPPPPPPPPPAPSIGSVKHRPLFKSTGSQSINPADNQELKQKPFPNDQTAQIVQAKYSYEPLQFSPNDHPEVELPLNIGDYYLIYGDVDEDGFYDGRNLEGRYGLIPSNFIEPIINTNELPEPVRHIIQRLTGKSLFEETVVPRRDLASSVDSDVFASNTSINTLPNYRKQLTPNQNGNPGDISTMNGLSFGKHVPCPTNLRVEKYLTNSVLIAWNGPSTTIQILGYQVLLDHSLYATIRVNERTRALIENINVNEKLHRLSIRTISQRGLSRDQECTLLLTMSAPNGNLNDFSYAPSDLRVDRINQTSAVVSWWSASNDIVHKLFVNDIEVQTLKAGVYRFKLSGLLPNTIHKVTIKAKPSNLNNIQQQQQQPQLATSIEFRTTSFDESIEPPQQAQVIAGPQSNTLLVSWEQPPSPSSTTAARGYRVMVDGRQIQDITNPLNDHTVINMNAVHHGRFLTVRTLTENDGESHDSIPVDLDEILKKLDTDNLSMTAAMVTEEIFDKESVPLTTASSSLTLRTTSDDEIANTEQQLLPPMEIQTKPFLPQDTPSPATTNSPPVRQPTNIISQTTPHVPAPSIKTTPTSHPDKIRPITKSSARIIGVTPIQSPSKSSSTASSMNTDVPQIEINSPSPNSPVVTSTSAIKSKNSNRDQQESRFGYDVYIKAADESPSPMKSPSSQRKPTKTPTAISPIKQRDHPDLRRGTATPINGNPMMNRTRMPSPRHTSTSSEEQHMAPPTPMKSIKLKEQTNPPAHAPVVNNQFMNKTNDPPRLFIALFDYDPNAMSPNKDNEEELPFKEGQLIRIYGDQDADGFYIGQTENGRTGFVPSNMVSEIQLDDAEIEAHLFAGALNLENPTRLTSTTNTASTTSTTTPTSAGKRISPGTNLTNVKSTTLSIKKMIAMFDYNPKEQSPNTNPDDELSFRSGEIIYVHGNVQDDGFYLGEIEDGRKGLVPSNFLKEISSMNTDENSLQQDIEQINANDNKKTSYRRGPHQV